MKPKLRFKEFTDDWTTVDAEYIFENIVDKGHPEENVLTIIQGAGTVPRDSSGRSIQYDELTLDNYKKVQVNDFIIHLRSFEAGLEIANSSGIVSPAYTILRNKSEIAPMFYRNYFRSDKFINQTLCSAVEGIRDGRQINYNQFKRLPIIYTEFQEQQKIAEFLSTVDEKIKSQQAIVESLEKQCDDILNKVFQRKIRFKNNECTPVWNSVPLRALTIQITKGTTPPQFNESGKIRFIKIESLDGTAISNDRCLFITEDTHNKELKRSILEEGDILFAIAGATVGK